MSAAAREVDLHGNCSKCGGTHYGSYKCPMNPESEVALNQGPSHADDSGSNPDLRAQDRQESLISNLVVSVQGETFVCTDGAGRNERPATADEKLLWAEIARLRTEHEEDLQRMECAAEAIELLTRERDEAQQTCYALSRARNAS